MFVNANFCCEVHNPAMAKKRAQEWIAERLTALGKRQTDLADALGLPAPRVNEIIDGRRKVQPGEITRFANFLKLTTDRALQLLGETQQVTNNLPKNETIDAARLPPVTSKVKVVDYVQAGKWRETIGLHEDERYLVPIFDERYSPEQLFGVEVRGDSMDLEYPPGRVLICRTFDPLTEMPPVGRDVIVRRRTSQGLVETTVKALELDDHGKGWLVPKSRNPEWQRETFAHNGDGDENDVDTEIIGVVLWDMRRRS